MGDAAIPEDYASQQTGNTLDVYVCSFFVWTESSELSSALSEIIKNSEFFSLAEAEMTEVEAEESVDTNKFENDDRKLFVGGLTWETTVEQLKAYFEKYGTVKDASIKVDGAGRWSFA